MALATTHAADPDRSVWHRAFALDGEAEQLSSDMEAAAARALRRGAPRTAVTALERAARLTEEAARRGKLLLDVAELHLQLGHPEACRRFSAEARSLELTTQEADASFSPYPHAGCGWLAGRSADQIPGRDGCAHDSQRRPRPSFSERASDHKATAR